MLTTATYLTSTVESPHHPSVDRRRFLLTSLAGAFVGELSNQSPCAEIAGPIGHDRTSSGRI